MSLVTVTAAPSDFVGSAWLVAVTVTVAGDGRSADRTAGVGEEPLWSYSIPRPSWAMGSPLTTCFTSVLNLV